MNKRKYLNNITKISHVVEVLISIFLVVGIIISFPDIIKYYYKILTSDVALSYELLQQFLSHVLLLVIAVEFIMLMIARNDATIIHIMSLVVSRKMLVYSHNMKDLILGVIAIFILFATRKFFVESSILDSEHENVYSATITIDELNKKYNMEIEENESSSLGALVSKLMKEKGIPVEVGAMVDDGNYLYEIKKGAGGLIETVMIDSIK